MLFLPALELLLDGFADKVCQAHPFPLVFHDLCGLHEEARRDADVEPLVGLFTLASPRHETHSAPNSLYSWFRMWTNVAQRVQSRIEWKTIRVPADLAARIQRICPDPWMPAYAKIQRLIDEREASTLARQAGEAEAR